MTCIGRCGVVVWRSDGALVSINEVNLRMTRLVQKWVTVSGCWKFISVCNQPPRPTQPSILHGAGKWGPASAGKEKAGMVHFFSGRGVCSEIRWERVPYLHESLRGVFTTMALYKSMHVTVIPSATMTDLSRLGFMSKHSPTPTWPV